MSSSAYFAEIQPEPILRAFVIGSASMLMVAGIAAIASLPLPALLRLSLAVAWAGYGIAGIRRHRDAYRDCRRLRVKADGGALLLCRGEWRAARVLPGSVLRERVGWLYLEPAGGGRFGELVRGDAGRDSEWRRLQVVWHHVGGEQGSC